MEFSDDAVLASETPQPAGAAPRRGPGRPTLSNEELLDRALNLFLENGFERTSIDAIAASTGMAKRTLYLRYEDKFALFKAALERAIDEWIIPVEQLRAAETDDFEETLLRIGQMLLANVMSPKGLRMLRITNAESARMPEIGAYTYRQGTERTLAYLADLFRRRAPAGGEMADADEAALAFMNLVVSGPPVMAAWGVALDQAAIDAQTRHSVRLFLLGLLPRGAGGGTPTADAAALEGENRRLRNLLVEAMLENAALKEGREEGRGGD
jgi:AcrR family transcriptional regulator